MEFENNSAMRDESTPESKPATKPKMMDRKMLPRMRAWDHRDLDKVHPYVGRPLKISHDREITRFLDPKVPPSEFAGQLPGLELDRVCRNLSQGIPWNLESPKMTLPTGTHNEILNLKTTTKDQPVNSADLARSTLESQPQGLPGLKGHDT